MTYSCPKCNAQLEFDPTEIAADGSFNGCTACGSKFLIRKKPFARRALCKGDEIICAECGGHPGSSVYCRNCHAIYPDFLEIESTSAAKRRAEKLIAALNALKNLKIGGAPKDYKGTFGAAPSKPVKSRGFRLPSHPAQLAAVLVVIIVASAGGGYYWYQTKIETAYTESYIRALLGIKSAKDLEIKVSGRLLTDMKTGAAATLTPAEKKSTQSAKSDVNTLLTRIGKVPVKFKASNDALAKLNDTFGKLHETVTSPPGTSDVYATAVKKIDDEFKRNSTEVKSAMSGKLAETFEASSKKYKPFQDF